MKLHINRDSFGPRGKQSGFLFAFTSGHWTVAYVYARGYLQDALEWAVDVIADEYPGLLCEPEYEPCDEHGEDYDFDCTQCVEQILSAEADLTYCDPGRYLPSETWTIVGDEMTPRELLEWWHSRRHYDRCDEDLTLA